MINDYFKIILNGANETFLCIDYSTNVNKEWKEKKRKKREQKGGWKVKGL